jgi:hypothetical protein
MRTEICMPFFPLGKAELIVDSVRPREASPCGIA